MGQVLGLVSIIYASSEIESLKVQVVVSLSYKQEFHNYSSVVDIRWRLVEDLAESSKA